MSTEPRLPHETQAPEGGSTEPSLAPADELAQIARRVTLGETWPVLALYVLATAVYALAGQAIEVPIIGPDEYTYGHLARSIADGEGLTWAGESFAQRSALYMFLVAPLWTIGSQTDAYALTKVFGAAAAAAVVFPTWLLARRFVGARTALIPAALSVAGAWMTVTGLVVTETVAYPLAAASLAAMVLTVARPGWRWSAAALVLAALATWARSQMVVLPVVLLLAVVAEASCHGSGWRERLAQHRALLIAVGAFAVAAPVLALAFPSLLGAYAGLVTEALHIERVLDSGRDQLAALLVMSGFLPLVIVLAGSLRGDVWRDPRLRPLLAVTWCAASVFIVQSAFALAFWEVGASVERYVMYCVPLLLVAMTALLVEGRVEWQRLLAAASGALVLVLLISGVRSDAEEPALHGLYVRTEPLVGSSTALGMALVLVVVAGAIATLVWRSPARTGAAVLAATLLTGLVLMAQSQASWEHRKVTTEYWRSGFPSSLSWIDERVSGPIAHFIVFRPPFRRAVTEFFNRRIVRTYAFDRYPTTREGLVHKVCSWSMDQDGNVSFESACGPNPTRLLLNDEAVSVTFHQQRVLAYERDVGRVVEIPRRAPRILALATPSCSTSLPIVDSTGLARLRPRQPLQCNQTFATNLFLDKPGTLVATFRGGESQGIVAMGAEQRPIAPLATVKLRSRQPAGASNVLMAVQPSGPAPANPQLVSLELVQDGRRIQLLY